MEWGLNNFWRTVSFKVSGTDQRKLLQNLKHCHLKSSRMLLSLLTGENNHPPFHNTTKKWKKIKASSHLQSTKPTAWALCKILPVIKKEIIWKTRCWTLLSWNMSTDCSSKSIKGCSDCWKTEILIGRTGHFLQVYLFSLAEWHGCPLEWLFPCWLALPLGWLVFFPLACSLPSHFMLRFPMPSTNCNVQGTTANLPNVFHQTRWKKIKNLRGKSRYIYLSGNKCESIARQ